MWAQIMVAILGAWLMSSPAVLEHSGAAATNAHIAGPAIACFAIIATWGVTRALRWINVALGLWLIAAPLVVGHSTAASVNSLLVGAAVAGLSVYRGRVGHRYAGGWRALWGAPPDREFQTRPSR